MAVGAEDIECSLGAAVLPMAGDAGGYPRMIDHVVVADEAIHLTVLIVREVERRGASSRLVSGSAGQQHTDHRHPGSAVDKLARGHPGCGSSDELLLTPLGISN